MKTEKGLWGQKSWAVLLAVLLVPFWGSGGSARSPTYAYPTEQVRVIARSVTFPQVLTLGQAIIDMKYPNGSLLCMDVANYSGMVIGLIWSMDRELVEEHRLQVLIDAADVAFFLCALMFLPPGQFSEQVEEQIGQRHLPKERLTSDPVEVAPAKRSELTNVASPHVKENNPAVSTEDIRRVVVPFIDQIQNMLKVAQSVKSNE